jgi:hypothetical protein
MPARKTREDFIADARKIHGDRYDYTDVQYKNGSTHVSIICHVHGSFLQIPETHLYDRSGCPQCFYTVEGSKTRFIDKAIKKYGNRYDYSLIDFKFMNVEVKIICRVHNRIFFQEPGNHIRPAGAGGCTFCSGLQISIPQFIEGANKIHEGYYDYSLVNFYSTRYDLIEIICPEHGIFEQTPAIHLADHGCEKCTKHISKGEVAWLNHLNIPEGWRQKRIPMEKRRFRADALDLPNKIIYEFYGDYWHGNPQVCDHNKMNTLRKMTLGEAYRLTMEREKLIKEAGYQIISIWGI